jgi:DNA mismatch repair protein MutS
MPRCAARAPSPGRTSRRATSRWLPARARALGPMLARVAPREVLLAEGAGSPPSAPSSRRQARSRRRSRGRASTRRRPSAGWPRPSAWRRSRGSAASSGRSSPRSAPSSPISSSRRRGGCRSCARPRERPGGTVQIDAATRRNLELTRSLQGGREDTLIATVDRTLTGGGARLLEARLVAPSTDVGDDPGAAGGGRVVPRGGERAREVRDILRLVPDLERALARLALERGGPRDLAALRERACRGGVLAAASMARCRRCWRRAREGCRARGARRSGSRRRWSPSRRCWRATAASSPRATTPSSTRRGPCATRGGA